MTDNVEQLPGSIPSSAVDEPITRKIITFTVVYKAMDGGGLVTEHFDGYATISGNGFAVSDMDTGVPFLIIPIDRLIEARSEVREIEVNTDGTPILN